VLGIRVLVHAVVICSDYPIKSVGLRMHRSRLVQGAIGIRVLVHAVVICSDYPIKIGRV
jgi:hypothetical protein